MIEQFTKQTAIILDIPEDIVHNVIYHQFKSVKEAFDNTFSVEINKIGTFYLRPKRLQQELDKAYKIKEAYLLRTPSLSLEKKLASIDAKINYLQTKLEHLNNG